MPYKYDGETLELYSVHNNTAFQKVVGLALGAVAHLFQPHFFFLMFNFLSTFEFFGLLSMNRDMAILFSRGFTILYDFGILMLVFAWLILDPFYPRTDVIVTTKGITFLTVVHLLRGPTEREKRTPILGRLRMMASDFLEVTTKSLDVERVVVRQVEVPWERVWRIRSTWGDPSTMTITFKDGTKTRLSLSRYRNKGIFFASDAELKEMKAHFLEIYRRATHAVRSHEEA